MRDYCLLEIRIGDRTVRSVEPIEWDGVLEHVRQLDHCTPGNEIFSGTEKLATPARIRLREQAFAKFTERFQREAVELFKSFDTFDGYKVEK